MSQRIESWISKEYLHTYIHNTIQNSQEIEANQMSIDR